MIRRMIDGHVRGSDRSVALDGLKERGRAANLSCRSCTSYLILSILFGCPSPQEDPAAGRESRPTRSNASVERAGLSTVGMCR